MMIRPDGALVKREFGQDAESRMVRRRRALMPHEDWYDRGGITSGHFDAADRYVRYYQLGLLGGRGASDDPKSAPAHRFHEGKAHHLNLLMLAQAALRTHERTVLDCTMLGGMTLDAYAAEFLRLPLSAPILRARVMGLVTSGLETLCDHWGITP